MADVTIKEAWDTFVNAIFNVGKTENTTPEETVQEPATEKEEEWVWVDGYKGMDKDMLCHGGFQYELGYRYDMGEDEPVETCRSGFHLCLTLEDVFQYVPVGNGNRFFQVRALVRKSEADKYGETEYGRTIDGWITSSHTINKLAAKSIEIIRELPADEIIGYFGYSDWEDKYKMMALDIDINAAISNMHTDNLVELGYTRPFAIWLTDNRKYEVAKAVGSQEDLSMDMKCLMILIDRRG